MGDEFAQWQEWHHDGRARLAPARVPGPRRGVPVRGGPQRGSTGRCPPSTSATTTRPGSSGCWSTTAETSLLAFLRRAANGDPVLAAFNFTPVPRDNVLLGVPEGGFWRELVNSDGHEYGGSGVGQLRRGRGPARPLARPARALDRDPAPAGLRLLRPGAVVSGVGGRAALVGSRVARRRRSGGDRGDAGQPAPAGRVAPGRRVDQLLGLGASGRGGGRASARPEPTGPCRCSGTVATTAPWSRVPAGDRYRYLLDGTELADPASRAQPDGVHGPSEVVDLAAARWADAAGSVRVPARGARHLRVPRRAPSPPGAPSTRRSRCSTTWSTWGSRRRADAHGPVSRAGATGATTGPSRSPSRTATAARPGCNGSSTPATRRGWPCVLDVVYNHLGPEGNVVVAFAPYLTDQYQTPWGAGDELRGPGSDEVRRFFIENARSWFTDFHVDALRLDAVHGDRRPHAASLPRRPVDGHGRAGGPARPALFLIAESADNNPRVITPPPSAASGMDAQWNDDFHHAVHAALTGERDGYYVDFGPLDLRGPGAQRAVSSSRASTPVPPASARRRLHGIDPEHFVLFVSEPRPHRQPAAEATGWPPWSTPAPTAPGRRRAPVSPGSRCCSWVRSTARRRRSRSSSTTATRACSTPCARAGRPRWPTTAGPTRLSIPTDQATFAGPCSTRPAPGSGRSRPAPAVPGPHRPAPRPPGPGRRSPGRGRGPGERDGAGVRRSDRRRVGGRRGQCCPDHGRRGASRPAAPGPGPTTDRTGRSG